MNMNQHDDNNMKRKMDVRNYIEKKYKKDDHASVINAMKANDSYYEGFIKTIEKFNEFLSNKKMNVLLKKFSLSGKFDYDQYIQHASELSVLCYILENYKYNFRYEPHYSTLKNPECSFEYKDKIINIEVKCPSYKKRNEQLELDGIKLMVPERFLEKTIIDEICKSSIINNVDLMDNKLKDFLLDAHEKFPSADDKYFNVLVIALPDVYAMDEWYVYLFGDKGVFSNETFIEIDLSNIDAFVLSDVVKNHRLNEINFTGMWGLENTVNLFLPNPKIMQNNLCKKAFYWKNSIEMFGPFTKKYHDFILKAEDAAKEGWEKVNNHEMTLEDYNLIYQMGKYHIVSDALKS